MRTKVVFHGYLSKFGTIEVPAPSVRHAIEAACRVCPGLRSNGARGRHRIMVAGCNSESDLKKPHDGSTIHIFPQFAGAKNGGIFQILIGAVLIGVSFLIPGAGFIASAAFALGGAFVLGGLVQMLSPKPEDNNSSDKSKYLGAPKNTVAVGTRIPIPYGKNRLYGHYLSFNVRSKITPA